MGGSGNMTVPAGSYDTEVEVKDLIKVKKTKINKGSGGTCSSIVRMPCAKPAFTLGQIKKAIPPHCFRRSAVRSFAHVAADLAACFALSYLSTVYFHLLPRPISYGAWGGVWVAQGFFMVGLWVLAHECGHHAFSDYALLDDTVGFFIHSALLVPYFSWKISHRIHHANANLLEKDEAFVPKLRSHIPFYVVPLLNNPAGRVLVLLSSAIGGWPMYLACNLTGRDYGRLACHFDPYSPMYTRRERGLIFLSDLGFLAGAYGLYRLALLHGLNWLVQVYVAPLLVVHATIVLIIYLHHTHRSLPRYDSTQWDWLRGALATVDRDYGLLNHVFHHIADTHVLHHLFSSIPHYHAVEASNAVKPLLGEYYQFDDTPILKAVWRELRDCIYIEPQDDNQTKGVYWFNNKF